MSKIWDDEVGQQFPVARPDPSVNGIKRGGREIGVFGARWRGHGRGRCSDGHALVDERSSPIRLSRPHLPGSCRVCGTVRTACRAARIASERPVELPCSYHTALRPFELPISSLCLKRAHNRDRNPC